MLDIYFSLFIQTKETMWEIPAGLIIPQQYNDTYRQFILTL